MCPSSIEKEYSIQSSFMLEIDVLGIDRIRVFDTVEFLCPRSIEQEYSWHSVFLERFEVWFVALILETICVELGV